MDFLTTQRMDHNDEIGRGRRSQHEKRTHHSVITVLYHTRDCGVHYVVDYPLVHSSLVHSSTFVLQHERRLLLL